jgi:hypothetical protein
LFINWAIFVFLLKVEAYRTDPLIEHGGVKLRFATAFGDAMDEIKQLIPSIQWPFLVIHGDADKLTYIGGSQLLEKDAKSEDKEIKVGAVSLLKPFVNTQGVYTITQLGFQMIRTHRSWHVLLWCPCQS